MLSPLANRPAVWQPHSNGLFIKLHIKTNSLTTAIKHGVLLVVRLKNGKFFLTTSVCSLELGYRFTLTQFNNT